MLILPSAQLRISILVWVLGRRGGGEGVKTEERGEGGCQFEIPHSQSYHFGTTKRMRQSFIHFLSKPKLAKKKISTL